MLRINTSEIYNAQSVKMPFNIEQAVNVDPIGDYIIKDGIDEYKFNRESKKILKNT
tara:strand:+ start:261 stop:428 length:168 start_codon:yes stop_codon:yes gene_type:complete